jgi:hypothetical protein
LVAMTPNCTLVCLLTNYWSGANTLVAIDVSSNSTAPPTLWTYPLPSPSTQISGLVDADGNVLTTWVVKAQVTIAAFNGVTGAVLWTTHMPGTGASLAITAAGEAVALVYNGASSFLYFIGEYRCVCFALFLYVWRYM